MKQLPILLAGCIALSADAAELKIHDFEDNAIGDVFDMKHIKGETANASATVTEDHTNDANKVLCIKSDSWETLVSIPLPEGITGQNFCDTYQTLQFDLLRLASSDDDYMQWVIMLGDDELYRDEGYPHQGEEEKWQQRNYNFKSVKNNATALYIGFNNDKADYYIDNIILSGSASQTTGTAIWTGEKSNVWDMATTPNFTDGTSPVTFREGNSAIFNDEPGADQIVKTEAIIKAFDVTFNNNRYSYTILPGENGGKITGRGTLVIDNGADVTLGVANELEGGTNLINGRLRLASVNTTAGFGKSINVNEGAIDFCIDNTSSSYAEVTTPIILNGNSVDVYTSRYTYWTSPTTGTGNINIYCGGERSYMGHQKKKEQPDWSAYTGTVTLYPYKEVISTAGFYGLVFEGNKTFSPEDYSINRTNHVFEHCKVIATDGTALATESNDRGVCIGELHLAEKANLYGYYKSSEKARSYFIIGTTGTDGILSGRMCPPEKEGKVVKGQLLGLIKEGKGTYTITNNNNRLTGGIRIQDGRILVSNNTEEARNGNLSGATGSMHEIDETQIFVKSSATLGGSGNISGNVDLFGSLQPGNDNIGTLTLADFAGGSPVSLIVRPSTRIEIELGTDGCDKIEVSNAIRYYNLTEEFEESDKMPLIKLSIAPGAVFNDGDEFTIISAKKKEALDESAKWMFDLDAPKGWRIEERECADNYSVVLITDKNASLAKLTDSNSQPYIKDGILIVSNAVAGETINLYSTDGLLLGHTVATNGVNAIPVNNHNGIIIVNYGDCSAKLTVK